MEDSGKLFAEILLLELLMPPFIGRFLFDIPAFSLGFLGKPLGGIPLLCPESIMAAAVWCELFWEANYKLLLSFMLIEEPILLFYLPPITGMCGFCCAMDISYSSNIKSLFISPDAGAPPTLSFFVATLY